MAPRRFSQRAHPKATVADTTRTRYDRLSLWSEDSVLSIASSGSVLSIGSVGSAMSIGSIGSFASAFSVASAGSVGSVMSAQSRASLLSYRTRGAIVGREDHAQAATVLAAALLGITAVLVFGRG
jgi:hypothetical protein